MARRRDNGYRWQHMRSGQPFRRLIPNLITMAGLCCGLSAIRFAIQAEPRWDLSVSFIIAAAFIDGLDGRAARMLRATSLFGEQLDSLSDFVCFGVAPALVLYVWGLHDIRGLGWAVALFYAMCCALRLARFNSALTQAKPAPWQKQFFTGVPSPAGGIICLLPLITWLYFEQDIYVPPSLIAAHVVMMGILMASRLPTFAAKNFRLKTEWVLPITIACAIAIAMLIIEPWGSLSLLSIIYLCMIPPTYKWYHRLEQENAPAQEELPTEMGV